MKKKISKRIAILIALLFLLVAATIAWFTMTQNTQTSGLSLGSLRSVNLDVSLDGENWGNNLTISLPETQQLRDISGNGLAFFQPQLDRYSGEVIEDAAWTQVTSGGYIEFDVWVSATVEMDVYLGSESTIRPAAEIRQGGDAEHKSAYGNFTKDYIAAATRLAVLSTTSLTPEEGEPLDVVLVWAPNPDVSYQAYNGSYMVYEQATPEIAYQYYDGSAVQTYSEEDIFYTELHATAQTSEGDVPIAHLDPGDANAGKARVRIRIWVEGTDREAVDALSDGQFLTELVLYGQASDGESRD